MFKKFTISFAFVCCLGGAASANSQMCEGKLEWQGDSLEFVMYVETRIEHMVEEIVRITALTKDGEEEFSSEVSNGGDDEEFDPMPGGVNFKFQDIPFRGWVAKTENNQLVLHTIGGERYSSDKLMLGVFNCAPMDSQVLSPLR